MHINCKSRCLIDITIIVTFLFYMIGLDIHNINIKHLNCLETGKLFHAELLKKQVVEFFTSDERSSTAQQTDLYNYSKHNHSSYFEIRKRFTLRYQSEDVYFPAILTCKFPTEFDIPLTPKYLNGYHIAPKQSPPAQI